MSETNYITRRALLLTIGFVFNGIVGAAIAVPAIGYLLSPVKKKGAYNQWISLGSLSQFPDPEHRPRRTVISYLTLPVRTNDLYPAAWSGEDRQPEAMQLDDRGYQIEPEA